MIIQYVKNINTVQIIFVLNFTISRNTFIFYLEPLVTKKCNTSAPNPAHKQFKF